MQDEASHGDASQCCVERGAWSVLRVACYVLRVACVRVYLFTCLRVERGFYGERGNARGWDDPHGDTLKGTRKIHRANLQSHFDTPCGRSAPPSG